MQLSWSGSANNGAEFIRIPCPAEVLTEQVVSQTRPNTTAGCPLNAVEAQLRSISSRVLSFVSGTTCQTKAAGTESLFGRVEMELLLHETDSPEITAVSKPNKSPLTVATKLTR